MDYKTLNNDRYNYLAMSILGTTNIFKSITITTSWIINPQRALSLAQELLNKINSIKNNSDKYPLIIAIGYINEFFTKYSSFGKSQKEIIKLNEIVDKGIKGDNKIINTLIELRKIRKIVNKNNDLYQQDQIIKTENTFGVSGGNVTGYIHNFKNQNENVPDSCIGIFPTSGVKFTTQFLKCKGIIFLNGAVTSHGSILARENNIPAIVAPKISIKNGTKVSIDGLNGIIKII